MMKGQEGQGGAVGIGRLCMEEIMIGFVEGIVVDLCWICRLVDLNLWSVVIILGLMSLVKSFGSKDLLDCLLTMNVGRRN